MGHPSTTAVALLLPLLLALTRVCWASDSYPQETTDSECDCFMTTGEETNYFTKHMFWDWRSLSNYSGTPGVIENIDDARDANETSDYFASDLWTSTWELQNWNNSGDNPFGGASYMMMNSLSNVYIKDNNDSSGSDAAAADTYLVLRTVKLKDFQSAAEFQSQAEDFHYLSMRMRARTVGSAGACTAMFTYREDDDIMKVQEADIEILTSGPTDVLQFTNQPSYNAEGDTVDDSTQNVTMPNGEQWTQWRTYRFDWSPGMSTWYVDDEHVASISFQAPKDPASLIINAWGDGGAWTGVMENNDAAYLQVQWFEVVYNTSTVGEAATSKNKRGLVNRLLRRGDKKKRCSVVCSIDETNTTGTPVMLWDSFAPSLKVGPLAWLPALVAAGMVLFLV